jgi:GAF domain-containing protein
MAETAERYERLVALAIELTSTLDLDDLLGRIMAASAELLDARSSSLLLYDEEDDTLRFAVSTGDPGLVGHRMPAGAGVAGECLRARAPVVVADAAADERVYREVDEAAGTETQSLLAVPLVARDRPVGVLEAMNKHSGTFTEDDVRLAQALGSLAAVAVDNATLYARLSDAVVTARLSYRLG